MVHTVIQGPRLWSSARSIHSHKCMFDIWIKRQRKNVEDHTEICGVQTPRRGKSHLGHILLAKAQSRGYTLLQRRLGNELPRRRVEWV